MTIPLIESPQSTEAVNFWASFWPSFWSGSASGVFTGLVTGLVVGYVLLRYQRGLEERSTGKAFARELSIKRDELRRALSQGDVLSIMSTKDAVPKNAALAIATLTEAPLTLWRDVLPQHKELLNHAVDLQKSYTAFMSLAEETDQILHQRVRAFNHQRGAISANDPVYHQLSVGMLFGIPINNLLPWLASHGPATAEPYIEAWGHISQDTRLMDLAPLLQQARGNLKSAANLLMSAIDA